VSWPWIALWISLGLGVAVVLAVYLVYLNLCRRYVDILVRIFQEKPLFIIQRGQPVPEGEEVSFPTPDGLRLHGCYLRAHGRRRGVILFGPEFGSNCWSCVPYCEHLLAHGFDVFAFEPRNQNDSEGLPGYEPLQWVTEFEVRDTQAALNYLKNRPDADPRGVGFFGISKGAGAGLIAAARDPYVRCCVTDGVFATLTTMIPYMRKWITIYSNRYWIQVLLPTWFYALVGRAGLRRIRRNGGGRFPSLERALPRLSPRPLLMIHGGADTYIKPDMARALFKLARPPKEFWLVDGAKHNQALPVAGDEYRRRVLEFFATHLADDQGRGSVIKDSKPEFGRNGPADRRRPAGRRRMALFLKLSRPGS